MRTGLTTLLVVALCWGAGSVAHADTPAGRKILQTTAPRGGACGAAVNARCPSGQCCSQWGFCGVTTSHCGTGCQALYSAPGSTCAGATGPTQPPPPPPVVPPTPPPATPPTPPPATPPAACVDSYAACPGWGPASCIYGGVPQLCPCMCGSSSGGPTPPPPTPPPQPPVAPPPQPPVVPPPQPPVAPPPQPPAGGPVLSSFGVSYHLYEGAAFPAIPEAGVAAQTLPGSNPGYTTNGLLCTDYINANPGIPWSSVGWTATTGIASGLLKCGDRICLTNTRNGATATAYVVDQGGAGSPTGFDLDYTRVFKALDPDNQNYLRGKMDITWAKC